MAALWQALEGADPESTTRNGETRAHDVTSHAICGKFVRIFTTEVLERVQKVSGTVTPTPYRGTG